MRSIGIFILMCFLLAPFSSNAQTDSKKGEPIKLLEALFMGMNMRIDKDAKRVIGDVKLQQEDVFMYCDSVYIYYELNNFKAFGNVRLVKGDSIEVSSDVLYHYGNRKLSKFRGNVRMTDRNMVLYTDSLNYDLMINQAYYVNGGRIVDSSSVLTSKIGRYFTSREVLFFQDSVVVSNDKMELITDTLEYHSRSNMTYFKGPTLMVSDTNYVYAEHGWYDLNNEYGNVDKNVSYYNLHQTVDCDTLLYYKKDKYVEAFSNIKMTSPKDSIIITSDYVYYDELNQSALITDSATLIQISASDTIYMHADTLLSYVDTLKDDIRNVLGYYHVQLYGNGVQMRCDSIAFSLSDSTVRLFGKPVIWSDSSQLKAKNIYFRIVDSELKEVYLKENAIIISQNDSVHFNQIKGFEITGVLEQQKLKKAIVNRRSETIYYLKDDNGELSAMNKTRCRQMNIYFENGLAQKIIWLSEPTGQVLPVKQINNSNMYFKDFEWLDAVRPKCKSDIYIWKPNSVSL